MNIYIHLMNGLPAYFDEKDQAIYFLSGYGRVKHVASSLRQIRKEQKIAIATDAKNGNSRWNYGYARYAVPEQEQA